MQRSLPRFAPLFVIVLTALSLLCVSPQPAQAQTPEPTPTATPAYQYGVVLSSGAEVVVVRSVTYGDVLVLCGLLLLAILFVFYIVLRSTKLWTAR